jgi:hypothetical protein
MVMPHVKPLDGTPGVIHALLKPRWEWRPTQSCFATKTQAMPLEGAIDGVAEVSYLVDRARMSLDTGHSAAEKKLARWVRIKLDPEADVDEELQKVSAWPCIAEAHIAPMPSLPITMGVSPR